MRNHPYQFTGVRRSVFWISLGLLLMLSHPTSMPAALTAAVRLDLDFRHRLSLAAEPLPREHRTLGPFFEQAEWDDGSHFMALRPFFSHINDSGLGRSRMEFLWPLGSWRATGDMRSGRILLAFIQNFDVDDPEAQLRFWVLPVFFSGRARDGSPYTAVFPLAGKIHDILGSDTVRFLLFPLYADTKQGSTETRHVLWPIFSITSGEQVQRWRVFPLYGQAAERDGTFRRFVLWPLYSSMRRENSNDDGSGFVLFPLFGRLQTEKQYTLMVLPPLFRYSTSPTVTEWMFPWPFLQRSTGDTEKMYIWPLWGRKSSGPISSAFFLWPLGRLGRQDRGDVVAVQRTFFPLYYSRQLFVSEQFDPQTALPGSHDGPSDAQPEDNPATARSPAQAGFVIDDRPVARYEKIWPLYSYQRSPRGSMVRIPDLWPGRPFDPIERNYAPFWTLYSHVWNAGAREQELLWGLFRRRSTQDGARQTQVFPLLDWQRDADAERREISLLRGLLRLGRDDGRWFGTLLYGLHWGPRGQEP